MKKVLVVISFLIIVGVVVWYLSFSGNVFHKPLYGTLNTDDWKTYTDEKAGFSIKYPPNFIVTFNVSMLPTEYNRVSFEHPDIEKNGTGVTFGFIKLPNVSRDSISDGIRVKFESMKSHADSVLRLATTTIAGFDGYYAIGEIQKQRGEKMVNLDILSIDLYRQPLLSYNTYVNLIIFGMAERGKINEMQDMVNYMISTATFRIP